MKPQPLISQFEWHRKPTGSGKLCSICGCPTKRLRAEHRALRAHEMWKWKGFWIKRFTTAFGLDQSTEVIGE